MIAGSKRLGRNQGRVLSARLHYHKEDPMDAKELGALIVKLQAIRAQIDAEPVAAKQSLQDEIDHLQALLDQI